jgi:serine/threonine-protein kinase
VQALMREILFEPLVPASVRAVELGVALRLPVHLDSWFSKCVNRDVEARFPSAKEAWEALAPVLGGELVTPAQLAALAVTSNDSSDRAQLELAATAAVANNNDEMAATVPAPGLSENNTSESKPAAIAVSGHSTGMSVGQTIPNAATPGRSRAALFLALGGAAIVGAISWQLATSRAERQQVVVPQKAEPQFVSAVESVSPALSSSAVPVAVAETPPTAASSIAVGSYGTRPRSLPAPPAPPAPPLPKPFDPAAAQHSVDSLARNVKHICSRLTGPRGFSISVTFGPSGLATDARVLGSNTSAPSITCARSVMRGAVVPPFDPSFGSGVAAAGVSLD